MDRLGLPRWLVQACATVKLVEPTPIQKVAIPSIIAGHNVLGIAPTGTGKTAAFVLPIVARFAEDKQMFIAVVASPTRELAEQVRDQFALFGERTAMRSCLGVGGSDLTKQKEQLFEGVHVVVGTPGRLAELASDPDIKKKLRRVKYAVFDEVDRLLDPSLIQDTLTLLSSLNPKRQTLLFSATVPTDRTQLFDVFGHPDKVHDIVSEDGQKDVKLTHKMIICPRVAALHYLHHLLTEENEFKAPNRGVIFVKTIKDCEEIREVLKNLDQSVTCLHSVQDARVRNNSLDKFKRSEARLLVATGVAARGLDMPAVEFVINLYVPREFDDYCHRVGRCARAGRPGIAVTIVCPELVRKDMDKDVMLQRIQTYQTRLGHKIEEMHLTKSATEMRSHLVAKAEALARVTLSETAFAERVEKRQKRRNLQAPSKKRKKDF